MATELPILACTLDAEGVREQGARYAEVARHVTDLRRTDRSLVAAVDAEADRELLDQLIATERACCPFFTITFDGATLTYATEHAAALDVIEQALTR
jgi:hypothetical protein